MLADLHSLAVNLRPATLYRLGLLPALHAYATELGRPYGVSVRAEDNGLEAKALTPDVETMLYRIAQEALTNAIRHANASQIGILATKHDGRLTVVIEDDGEGFDVEEAVRGGGLGLVGMRERAKMLGGVLTIESRLGQGTAVYIQVPLNQP